MNLLSINNLSKSDIYSIFDIADRIKTEKHMHVENDNILALLFEKPSTRTRVSFESAMLQLGGHVIYIDARTTQSTRGEPVKDTARVLGSYVDLIAARLYRQSDLKELAKYAGVPVINALTDLEHPCQALSDLYTIRGRKGDLDGIKIAFIGDIATNTANSLMLAGTKTGSDMVLVGPGNWKPNTAYVKTARKYGTVSVYDDPKKGLKDVDIVYTDTFVSMGVESEAEKRLKLFKPYQLNKKLLSYAKRNALVMHCLPAHRGEEITADVLDGPRSIAWEQSANKLLVEKAIILYLYGKKK